LPNNLPPSGPWTGYYLYPQTVLRHRMRLGLTFTPEGRITGDGVDDIAPFLIEGTFDQITSKASWIKQYVGRHKVDYAGIYNGRAICGEWTIRGTSDGFWIWPEVLGSEGNGVEIGVEEPVEVLTTIGRIGRSSLQRSAPLIRYSQQTLGGKVNWLQRDSSTTCLKDRWSLDPESTMRRERGR
jgi:hypothetical protein